MPRRECLGTLVAALTRWTALTPHLILGSLPQLLCSSAWHFGVPKECLSFGGSLPELLVWHRPGLMTTGRGWCLGSYDMGG